MHRPTWTASDASLALIAFESRAYADYDFSYCGSRAGVVVDQSFGPMSEWSTSMPLFDVGVYRQQLVPGGFQTVEGESFVRTAVPEPRTYALLRAGLIVLQFSILMSAVRMIAA